MRRAALIVALANLGYFVVEFTMARAIGSVSLLADSIDFLEDASVNVLVLMAIGWSARSRTRVASIMAILLLVPASSALWTAWEKFRDPVPPEPGLLSLTALGALMVNVSCALLLARYRRRSSSLTKAAYLSARNDAFSNVAIILAALVTMVWMTGWPDLIVGLAIAALNVGAAREVWEAARAERRSEEQEVHRHRA